MRIAIDLQGIQSDGSRTRGIGRYSLEIVKNMIREFNKYLEQIDMFHTMILNNYCSPLL